MANASITESFPAAIPAVGAPVEIVTSNLEAAGFITTTDSSKPAVFRLEEETDKEFLERGYTHRLVGESYALSAYDPVTRVSYTLSVRDPRIVAYFVGMPLFTTVAIKGVATKVTPPAAGHTTTTINVAGRIEVVANGAGPAAKVRVIAARRAAAAAAPQSAE